MAHRLALSAAEFALLCARTQVRPPSPFGPAPVDDEALRSAAATLAARRIVLADPRDPLDCRPVEPIAANLAILARPRALIQVEISVRGRGLLAAFAVAGPLGAGLVTLPDGAAELSMFAAVALGREVVRAVPTPAQTVSGVGIARLLDPGVHGGPLPTGRLPLLALAEYGAVREFGGAAAAAGALDLTEEQAVLAAEVLRRTRGVLRAVVTGAIGPQPVSGGEHAVRCAVGQVVWLSTDGGWLGLRPAPEGSRLVSVEPVAREDLGGWLAAYLAPILEDSR